MGAAPDTLALWISARCPKNKDGLTVLVARTQAGERAGDIFMGVDCFGRGSYGGGGWRCDVALRACLDAGLSGEAGAE